MYHHCVNFLRYLLSTFVITLSAFFLFTTISVSAATTTVCASGCDYTTITAAIAGSPSAGDVIAVGATYASTTETFPFNIPSGVDLDCQDSGAVIGTDVTSTSVNINTQNPGETTIRNCKFSNVQQQNTNVSLVHILNNLFTGNARVTFDNATSVEIGGNTIHQGIQVHTSEDVLIDNNDVYTDDGYTDAGLLVQNTTSVTVTGNVFKNFHTAGAVSVTILDLQTNQGTNLIATNTIMLASSTYANGSDMIHLSGTGYTVTNNLIRVRGDLPSGNYFNGIRLDGASATTSADIEHNTIVFEGDVPRYDGITINGWGDHPVSATATYNLIDRLVPSSTASGAGFTTFSPGSAGALTVFSEYNGFAGLNSIDNTSFASGTGSIERDFNSLKTDDTSTTNDFELVPYSVFLDVNGSVDIGGVSVARGNDFHIDASGTIDYSSVDATTTARIMGDLRDGDTVTLANATYAPFTLSSHSGLTGSGVTIQGVGSGTIINSNKKEDALTISGVSGASFKHLTAQNALAAPVHYTITNTPLRYGGHDYNDSASTGGSANAMVVMSDASACTTNFITADGTSVDSYVGGATDDWNLALVSLGALSGARVTVMVPNNVASSPSDITTGCSAYSVTIDKWIPSIFMVDDGKFTYNSSAAMSNGVTVVSGFTTPPALSSTGLLDYDGFGVYDSGNNTFTNVTSTGNFNGIHFKGASSTGNVVKDSYFASNEYDITDEAAGAANTLQNVTFNHTSTTFSNGGHLIVNDSVRAYITSGGTPLDGISVTLKNASGTSETLTTDSTGYTAYTAPLKVMMLSAADNAVTAGSFNPVTASFTSTNAYNAKSTSVNVSTPYQTLSLTLTAVASTPENTGGGGGGPTQPPHGYATTGYSIDPALVAAMQELGYAFHQLVKLPDDGDPLTQDDSTVYYLGVDGRRHAFPNPGVFFSWYCDFSHVTIIPASDLAKIPLGRNVEYRPGLRLVKFPSVPTVYLVQTGGILRPIPDEATAAQLFGPKWNKMIFDISEAFYGDYVISTPLISPFDLRSLGQTPSTISGNLNFDGYSEPPLTGVTACSATSASVSPSSASTPIPASVWLSPEIPKDFVFWSDLGPTSGSAVEIRYLQDVLVSLGPSIYPEAIVNGVYGPATTSAVRRFQASKGLSTPGVVGPQTRAALNAILDQAR